MTDINGSLDTYCDEDGAFNVVSNPCFAPSLHMKVKARKRTWTVINVKSGGWYTDHKFKDSAEKAAVKLGLEFLKAYSIDRKRKVLT